MDQDERGRASEHLVLVPLLAAVRDIDNYLAVQDAVVEGVELLDVFTEQGLNGPLEGVLRKATWGGVVTVATSLRHLAG